MWERCLKGGRGKIVVELVWGAMEWRDCKVNCKVTELEVKVAKFQSNEIEHSKDFLQLEIHVFQRSHRHRSDLPHPWTLFF